MINKHAPYFLSAKTRYDAAYSLCGQAGLLLFKFTEDFKHLHADCLITVQPNQSYNFIVSRTKVSIFIPEELQQPGMIWTRPTRGEHCDLVFPVAAISIVWAWTPPSPEGTKLAQLGGNDSYKAYAEATKGIQP
jgi:hypothetical protein